MTVAVQKSILLVLGLLLPVVSGAAEPLPADAVQRCFALRRSEPAAALALARSVLSNAGLSVGNEIKMLACLGLAAGISGDAATAGRSAERIETLLSENPMPPEFSLRALSNAGAIYHTAGLISRAEALYMRAYAVAEAEDAIETQIVTLTNIGLIHAEYLGAPEEADRYYRQAFDLAEGQSHDILGLRYHHAANLVRLGRLAEARRAIEAALDDARAADNPLYLARLNSEQAALQAADGDADGARQRLVEAIETQESLPDPEGQALSLARLSALQRAGRQAQAALASARKGLALASGGHFHFAQLDSLSALAAAQMALGLGPEAMATLGQRHALEINALKNYDRDVLAELQAQLQNAAGTREIEALRHAGELQALRMDRDRTVRRWLIGGFALLLAGGLTFGLTLWRSHRRLKILSAVDMLTGLANRRSATERLNRGFAETGQDESRRHVLLLLDIDRFKSINDHYGHDVGDRVLSVVSARLRATCRPGDIVARWGGEEFLIACESLSREQACAFAERLRVAVSEDPVALAAQQRLPVSASVGFAPYPFFPAASHGRQSRWENAIQAADRALYAAKHAGRDAWAGLWGEREPCDLDFDDITADPEQAELDGWISILSSRSLCWREQRRPRANGTLLPQEAGAA